MKVKTLDFSEIKSVEEFVGFVQHHTKQELLKTALEYWGIACDVLDDDRFLTNWDKGFKNSYYLSEGMLESICDVKEHIEEYNDVYALFRDEDSKALYLRLLIFKLCGDRELLGNVLRSNQYFYEDFMTYCEGDVFVDCGFADGSGSAEYMLINPRFKRIYAYEPNNDSFMAASGRFSYFIEKNLLSLKMAAAYDKKGTIGIVDQIYQSRVEEDSDCNIPTITLDDDITEPVSFIKMDIEGAEKQALIGARRHISEDMPTLAVCVYHLADDLWSIPMLINSFNPNYTYYLRHHGGYGISNLVFYCIPTYTHTCMHSHSNKTNERDTQFYAQLCTLASGYLNAGALSTGDYGGIVSSGLLENFHFTHRTIREQQATITELRQWIAELTEGKNWLEAQYLNYKKLYEDICMK